MNKEILQKCYNEDYKVKKTSEKLKFGYNTNGNHHLKSDILIYGTYSYFQIYAIYTQDIHIYRYIQVLFFSPCPFP